MPYGALKHHFLFVAWQHGCWRVFAQYANLELLADIVRFASYPAARIAGSLIARAAALGHAWAVLGRSGVVGAATSLLQPHMEDADKLSGVVVLTQLLDALTQRVGA